MQIHELPSGTPETEDMIPFDTGESNYKTPFSGFDVGENTATFESADEADPQIYKTVDQIETGPIKTIFNRLSMIASNVRYIWKMIGSTNISGIADGTITGAINNVGSFKCVNITLPQVSGESVLGLVQRAFESELMPKGVPFIAQVVSGLSYTLYGYWYLAGDYGYCIVSQYWNAYKVNLSNGSWSIRGITRVEDVASGYLTTATALGTSLGIIPFGANLTLRGDFSRVSDGGYRTLKSGTFKISAYAYVTGVNSGDAVPFHISRYNGGWVSDSPGVLTIGNTERSLSFPTMIISANENDIFYLRGRNVSAARGSVTSARILIEPVY